MSEERYQQAVQILSEALKFGIHPSLDGIREMMAKMGNPHTQYRCIQIAGTNGKTSTTRQITAMLHAHGLKCGLYTSPHLVEYPERVEINGKVSSHDLFADAIIYAKQVADELECEQGMTITEFELITAGAFWMFAQEHVDVAVLECGMGGRWDSTSIITPEVAVVTGIGFDHIGILGNTQEEIAAEKAAIIKAGCKSVLGPGTQNTLPVFLQQVREVGSKPWLVRGVSDVAATACNASNLQIDETPISGFVAYEAGYGNSEETIAVNIQGVYANYDGITMQAPLYQAQNISTAVAAAELFLEHAMDAQKVRDVIGKFAIPGRFETLCENPLLIIDAAHNPQSALNLATAIANKFPQGDFQLLLAVLADKDAHGIIEALAGLTPDIAVTQTSSDRALSRFELADMVEQMTGTRPEIFDTPAAALDELLDRQVNTIASGSITLAGEVKAAWINKATPVKSYL